MPHTLWAAVVHRERFCFPPDKGSQVIEKN
jgi:hypothetical protein